jgi:ATP-binding cassette, subfamily C, bacterial
MRHTTGYEQTSAPGGRSLYEIVPGRSALFWVVLFSIAMNVLLLILPFYWIQVFDRVITSGSVETLVALTVLAVGALIFGGMFDTLRSRLLSRFAVGFERSVAPLVLQASIVDPAKRDQSGTHDLVRVRELRNFLSSGTVSTLVDAPFLPAFVAVLYLIHPWFGIIALVGGVILASLGYVSAKLARAEIAQASDAAIRTQSVLESIVRHANLVRAMGWTNGAVREFMRLNDAALAPVVRASERVAAIASIARVIRLVLQVAVIGTGAWLMLQNELLAGSMIASSIIISRTLQPVEALLSAWRALASAHDAWTTISSVTSSVLARKRRTLLPPPLGMLEVSHVVHRMAGARRPILAGVSFRSKPADIVVIIGPTGAGKSTLLRMIAGLERPTGGTIRLDHAPIDMWEPDQLGRYIGYLPQDIELLGGTVAEAIAGFEQNARDEDIVAAAFLARAHDMILALPKGYETEIGRDGCKLSGGQRQRIGLARAFFGDRKLILLDEPNSNLDPEGEEALCEAMKQAQSRGATLVIVTHRPRVLTIANSVLLLRDGVQVAFGPPSEVLRPMVSGATPIRHPRAAAEGAGYHPLSSSAGAR